MFFFPGTNLLWIPLLSITLWTIWSWTKRGEGFSTTSVISSVIVTCTHDSPLHDSSFGYYKIARGDHVKEKWCSQVKGKGCWGFWACPVFLASSCREANGNERFKPDRILWTFAMANVQTDTTRAQNSTGELWTFSTWNRTAKPSWTQKIKPDKKEQKVLFCFSCFVHCTRWDYYNWSRAVGSQSCFSIRAGRTRILFFERHCDLGGRASVEWAWWARGQMTQNAPVEWTRRRPGRRSSLPRSVWSLNDEDNDTQTYAHTDTLGMAKWNSKLPRKGSSRPSQAKPAAAARPTQLRCQLIVISRVYHGQARLTFTIESYDLTMNACKGEGRRKKWNWSGEDLHWKQPSNCHHHPSVVQVGSKLFKFLLLFLVSLANWTTGWLLCVCVQW